MDYRWHVAMGGYPDGWDTPFLKTNDPEEAIAAYEAAKPGRMQICGIFDDLKGEGESLSAECVADRVADEEYERDVLNYTERRDRFSDGFHAQSDF
jgi:hypothetical protein